MTWWGTVYTFFLALLMTVGFVNARHLGAEQHSKSNAIRTFVPLHKRLNLVDPKQKHPSPNPAGWEAYDGSMYTQERGYGWTTQLSGFYAGGGGEDKAIRHPGGEMTTPRALGRLELATWQGTHQENQPLVFRIDLPNGWYRVRCASVAHGDLPVIDQRNFSCRAQDAVFAGSQYGPPLKVRGRDLVEGSNVVEVIDGHLRIVVGDPAYGGWTWSYKRCLAPRMGHVVGQMGRGDHRYAETWYQKLTRVIDPGFHHLRLNSVEIERVPAPAKWPAVFFRDFFNRDDSPDINSGVTQADQWVKVRLHPARPDRIESELYKTSLKLIGPKKRQRLARHDSEKAEP